MIYMSFFIGLILICKGGDWFVDAASKLSEILGIPKYVLSLIHILPAEKVL